MTRATPLARRRATVRALGSLIRRIARRRRCSWLDARRWLTRRLGLDLRGWHDLSAGRLGRVPAVALERLALVREQYGDAEGVRWAA